MDMGALKPQAERSSAAATIVEQLVANEAGDSIRGCRSGYGQDLPGVHSDRDGICDFQSLSRRDHAYDLLFSIT